MANEPGEVSLSSALADLIERQEWDELAQRLTSSPSAAEALVLPSHGWTIFHWLCSMGSVPPSLIALIADICPQAIIMPDAKYGDTPLHIICRNSQTQAEKINMILQRLPPGKTDTKESLLIRNRFGGTALHLAAYHNARLEALQALLQAEPKMLQVKTFEGVHAITAMWHAYIQTIPGFMLVARILEGDDDVNEAGHFGRFLQRVTYLATTYFLQSSTCPADTTDARPYLLHGLLQCNVPIKLFRLALKRNAALALTKDAAGNLPLHILAENRPYRLKEREAVQAALDAAPASAGIVNTAGDTALVLAIRNKIPWENGVDLVLAAATTVVNRRDVATGLLPFMLAASVGGKSAVDTTYHLLCTQPALLAPC